MQGAIAAVMTPARRPYSPGISAVSDSDFCRLLAVFTREMIRRGEINPFELKTLMSANAHDYAAAVINLLVTMKPGDPQRRAGLQRIKRWVDNALAGVVDANGAAAAEGTRED